MDSVYNKLINSVKFESLWDCSNGYMDSLDCSWYHQNWMYLRMLHLVSNPMWHKDFYDCAIKKWGSNNANVLVLGTADFSMPFLCYRCGIKKIDICDVCQTPLNICDAVAKLFNLDWNTYIADIRMGLNRKYGVIIDDAFLTRFDYSSKREVLSQIANSLSPSGVYITTVRKGWNNGNSVIPTSAQKKLFIEKAVKSSAERKLNINNIIDISTTYINNMLSYPIKDIEHLYELVSEYFRIEEYYLAEVPGECEPTTYFQVVLKKL